MLGVEEKSYETTQSGALRRNRCRHSLRSNRSGDHYRHGERSDRGHRRKRPYFGPNLDTGQVIAAASSATGNYTVSQLPIGDYDLTVAVPGFKTYTHSKFHLAAAQTMREDVPLEVGQTLRNPSR